MTTAPMDLPAEAPAISDAQRSRVLAAERALEREHSPAGVDAARDAVDEVTAAAGVDALTVQAVDGTAAVEYRRSSATLLVGTGATMPAILHELAHHLTDATFPAHGAEWAANFLALIERFLSVEHGHAYRAEFDHRSVHYDPAIRIHRVRKGATGAVNKERGVLARLVVDDPPESFLCQILAVDRGGLSVRTPAGERYLENERLRYVSYSLRDVTD